MPDTQGANLEGDMPGVGTAPPVTGVARSPLQLPSALQGLAKFFQQSQGRSAPKPSLPPKPSPLTEEQANQSPQHVGRPQSLAPVPATVPITTGGWTPYIKTADRREPSDWGNSTWFPRLPSVFELAGMFNQIGQHFAQAGGDVGTAGADLAYHSEAYWDGFMKGQDHKMKMARDGVALASAQLEHSILNRLIDTKDTYAAYNRAAGGDPTKLATTKLNGVDLYHALAQNAYKNGDAQAQSMFEAGRPLEEILNYLGDEDKTLRDLQAARQKASDQDDSDSAYDLKKPEGAGGGAAEGWGTAALHGRPPPSTPPPPGGGPPPPAQPDKTEAKPEDNVVPDALKDVADAQHPELINAATDLYMGNAPLSGELDKKAFHHVRLAADALGAETAKILADPNLKPGQYVDAVRKRLGARPAAELQGIENYDNSDLTSGTGSGKRALHLTDMQNIALKDMPGDATGRGRFNAANFALQKDFKDDKGKYQNVLVRTGDMASTLRNLHDDLDRLQKEAKARGYGPNDLDLGTMIGQFTGTGVANRVRSDLEAYAAAYDYVVSSGRSTITGREAFSNYFSLYMPISTLRDTLKGHVPSTMGIIQGIHTHWESIGGKKDNMPGIEAATEKEIIDYGKQDTFTGALPYDPNRDNDIFLKKAGPWGPAGKYYWTGESQTRDDPSNWKPVK